MRLHALEFTGIGPFRERQVIDFDRLAASGLFLIDGPTGAGKTTIIDAIVFALYGDVSGREADDSRLRSDYSAPAEPSEVVCEFSVGDRRIWIRRTPRYLRAKVRGEGTTQVPASQLLREVDQAGEVRAELTHAAEIGARIGELLGMSAQQFRQLVVLPQGEFADLLRMKPLERFAALGPLLGDGFYRRLQDEIEADGTSGRARIAAALAQVHDARQRLLGALGDLDLQPVGELAQALDDEAREARAQVDAAASIIDWIDAQSEQQEAVAQALESQVHELRQQVDRFDAHDAAARALAMAEQVSAAARQTLGPAGTSLQRAEAVTQVAKLQQGRGRIEPWVAWEQAASTRATHRAELVEARDRADREQAEAQDELAALPERRRLLQATLAAVEQLAATADRQAAEVTRLAVLVEQRAELVQQEALVQQAADVLAEAVLQSEAAERAVADGTAELEEQMLALLHARAGVLALELHDGQPCPVCGAPEHPAPAPVTGSAVSDEELAARRAALDDLRAQAQRLRAARDEADARLRALEASMLVLRGSVGEGNAAQVDDQLAHARAAAIAAQQAVDQSPALHRELAELDALEQAAQERVRSCASARAARQTELELHDAQEERSRVELAAILGAAESAQELAAELDARVALLSAFIDAEDAVATARAMLPDDAPVGPEAAAQVRAALAAASQALSTARAEHGRLAHAATASVQPLAELRTAVAALAAAEDESAAAISLADAVTAARTSINRRRLTLQSYAVQRRFAAVLEAASLHLARMSGGKYTLVLDDQARGNAQGGLGIRVHDAWTGQQRDPRSLSGGETFYAALALALGLADVVRDEAGGTQLETLFVDEGFGSLDQESLQLVLEQLDALRSGGRIVGVVSHVTEMKDWVHERIDVSVGRDRTSTLRLVT